MLGIVLQGGAFTVHKANNRISLGQFRICTDDLYAAGRHRAAVGSAVGGGIILNKAIFHIANGDGIHSLCSCYIVIAAAGDAAGHKILLQGGTVLFPEMNHSLIGVIDLPEEMQGDHGAVCRGDNVQHLIAADNSTVGGVCQLCCGISVALIGQITAEIVPGRGLVGIGFLQQCNRILMIL